MGPIHAYKECEENKKPLTSTKNENESSLYCDSPLLTLQWGNQ